jgi:hypothetical protein
MSLATAWTQRKSKEDPLFFKSGFFARKSGKLLLKYGVSSYIIILVMYVLPSCGGGIIDSWRYENGNVV